MILNLTDILTAEGRTVKKEIEFTPSVLEYSGCQYPVLEKQPVFLTISSKGKGRAEVAIELEMTVGLCCDRCLKEVPYHFSLKFSRQVFIPELEAAVSEEEQDTGLFGYQFDVDDLIYDEISVEWPMKVLCKPDCKGICSVCGGDLNEGTCGCDTFVPDPRLAAIKDIFNAGKEV